jgi:hypothetical protein
MKNEEMNYSIRLNHETWILLMKVRDELVASLGFVPTNGQVVRHLLASYFGETK